MGALEEHAFVVAGLVGLVAVAVDVQIAVLAGRHPNYVGNAALAVAGLVYAGHVKGADLEALFAADVFADAPPVAVGAAVAGVIADNLAAEARHGLSQRDIYFVVRSSFRLVRACGPQF